MIHFNLKMALINYSLIKNTKNKLCKSTDTLHNEQTNAFNNYNKQNQKLIDPNVDITCILDEYIC